MSAGEQPNGWRSETRGISLTFVLLPADMKPRRLYVPQGPFITNYSLDEPDEQPSAVRTLDAFRMPELSEVMPS